MNAKELRKLVVNKNKPKQDKYMIKLRKKLDKCAKRGYNQYELINTNYCKIFTFDFKMRIENELTKDGFMIRVGITSIRIYW